MESFSAKCRRAFEILGRDDGVLLIVPPFADLYQASLGVHLLQACAKRARFNVKILYANLLFADLVGESVYNAICYSMRRWLWGERIFSAKAFDLPPLGRQNNGLEEQIASDRVFRSAEVTPGNLSQVEAHTERFCSELAMNFAATRFQIAGATTTFQQTSASIALLRAIRAVRPGVLTLIGGANCEGPLAEGVASLRGPIDYVFSGECETCFTDFLRGADAGDLPAERIVRGSACLDMDGLPEPCFDDYFAQLDNAISSWRAEAHVWLPYETSRGCWWGAKQHCTFCGLNGETMAFREKSPGRAVAGLKRLIELHPSKLICMADNILPFSYFQTVLSELAQEQISAHIFYEIKANLNLEQVHLLKRAGVGLIQPGIEALSSAMLRRLKKGVLGRQNVDLLRYARATGLAVNWNLLYDIPGDEIQDYESTIALIRLVHHLNPPAGLHPITIDRFSPYFRTPHEFGIEHVRPTEAYSWIFPDGVDLSKLAYHFNGDYRSATRSNPPLLSALEEAYEIWRGAWTCPETAPPVLEIAPVAEDRFLLLDTRGLPGTDELQFLTREQAQTALAGRPLEKQPLAAWAIERKLAVAMDGWCVPLAVAQVEILKRFTGGSNTALVSQAAADQLVQVPPSPSPR